MELQTFQEKADVFHDILIKLKDSSRDVINAAVLNERDNVLKAAMSMSYLWNSELQAAEPEFISAFQAVKTDAQAQLLFDAEVELYASVLSEINPFKKEVKLKKFSECRCVPCPAVKLVSHL